MEILGLSPSTRKPESWWKNLFWPTIRNEVDVDYVGRQGYWISAAVGLFTFAATALSGVIWAGVFEAVFFVLGGIGVRQRSRFAALAVFVAYLFMTIVGIAVGHGMGIVDTIFMALLLANVRATLLSAKWREDGSEPPPLPLNETFFDKVADRLPIYVWPAGRWFFYVMAVFQMCLLLAGLIGTLQTRGAQ